MARCLNCIHFDVCNHDRREHERAFGRCTEFLSEEDVVPRSLFDAYKREVEDALERLNTINEDKIKAEVFLAKQEVAKQIFEEIEKLMHKLLNDEQYIAGDMCWDITELKKKYIGETK